MTITREDLIEMPAHAYMNDVQLAFFRTLLEDMRGDLAAREREQGAEASADDLMATPDPSDRATLEEERTLAFRERERARERLRQIAAALIRIDRGEYGYCEVTGDEIGIARLLANPVTTRSIEAQQRAEQANRLRVAA